MKKTIIYIIISLCWFSVSSMKSGFGSRAEKDIVLHPTNHPHTEVNPPADMPDVYYNSELGVITINEKSCTITDVDPNSNIMINHRQNIPFIAPLILQNETIENDQYIIATSLTAGNHVDNRTSGDFIIPSGKQFEVEYSDKVVLAPGFKVNKGGIFKARLGASTYKNR